LPKYSAGSDGTSLDRHSKENCMWLRAAPSTPTERLLGRHTHASADAATNDNGRCCVPGSATASLIPSIWSRVSGKDAITGRCWHLRFRREHPHTGERLAEQIIGVVAGGVVHGHAEAEAAA
jgi:hypothetical protein